MAKIINAASVKDQIKDLQTYRSGWSNDIREGWKIGMPGSQELLLDLYQISGCIILALNQITDNSYRDKMAMILIKRKLLALIHSQTYQLFDEMGKAGFCYVVTTGTKHHIRVMMECLEFLTA